MGNMYEDPAHGGGAYPAGFPAQYPGAYQQGGGESRQKIIDDEQLRLLRIGYFISAGQTAIFIPFGLLYAGMGVMFSAIPSTAGGTPPPPEVSWIFGILGAVFAGLATLGTVLKLLTAIRLKERRSRVLCLVTAALSCIEIPYGTALGIMTFVVLSRYSVRQQFEGDSP
ncbi:MAG: hypothetical protein ACOY0T_29710 [Myxococcota bacterium]